MHIELEDDDEFAAGMRGLTHAVRDLYTAIALKRVSGNAERLKDEGNADDLQIIEGIRALTKRVDDLKASVS